MLLIILFLEWFLCFNGNLLFEMSLGIDATLHDSACIYDVFLCGQFCLNWTHKFQNLIKVIVVKKWQFQIQVTRVINLNCIEIHDSYILKVGKFFTKSIQNPDQFQMHAKSEIDSKKTKYAWYLVAVKCN